MAAILIGESDFESIQDVVGQHCWENVNLNYPLGYWIPAKLLQAVPGYGDEILPLIEIHNLPIFYENLPVDRFVYNESLTCLCRSRAGGSEIKGISILPRYWYEPHYFEFKRCFRYQEAGEPERYWRIISDEADIEWLKGCWDKESAFFTWYRHNALI